MTDVTQILSQIEQGDPTAAEVFKLRYFAGMPVAEAAEALGTHRATANRHWAYARAWIRANIQGTNTADS